MRDGPTDNGYYNLLIDGVRERELLEQQQRREQRAMSRQLPMEVRAIRNAYVAKHPVPGGGTAGDPGFEQICRQWTNDLAEQIRYSTGDPRWGSKNAGGGRPQSKDSIAEKDGATLWGYDMLFGVGTGNPSLVDNPSGTDISNQTFIPVEPQDHIGDVPGSGPGPDPGDEEQEADQDQRIAQLEAAVAHLEARILALEEETVLVGSTIALRAHGKPEDGREGKLLCAEGGGPAVDYRGFNLTARTNAGPWESWKVERGQ